MTTHKKPGRISYCRSCNAEIVWTRTSGRRKAMPCDMIPSDEGTFFLFRQKGPDGKFDSGHIESVHIGVCGERVERARAADQKRYTSHFATCPNAGQHRKG